MISSFHSHLMTTNSAYASWHNEKDHILAHWVLFLLISFFTAGSLLSAINSVSAGQGTPPDNTLPTLAFSQGKQREPAQDHILLKFKQSASESHRQDIYHRHNLTEKDEIKQIGVKIVSISPDDTPEEVVQNMKRKDMDALEFVEVDPALAPTFIPNDPNYSQEWHLPKIQAPQAWDSTTGSSVVTIAILDSGVDCTHPDLFSHCVPGYNFYDNNTDTRDVTGHGTAVAGNALEIGNNNIGGAGLCWNCLLMPLRIASSSGYASGSAIANALVYAADHGSRVANVSYGNVSKITSIINAAQYFQSKNGLVVISAGNSTFFDSSSDQPNFVMVSATDQNDIMTSWSNTGNNIDLSAPGQQIFSTMSGGSYGWGSGTSFSSPLVAGVAALVISANPSLTGQQVQDILKQSADDLGTSGWDPQYGWGRVNAYKAVTLACTYSGAICGTPPPADTTLPLTSITSPTAGQTVSGTISISASATDNVGVTKVELWKDNTLFSTDTSSPYTFTWNTTSDTNTTHTLQTKAYDANANIGQSSPLTVSVNNAVFDTTPPSPPTLSYSSLTPTGVTLSWTASTDNVGVTGYKLYRNNTLFTTLTTLTYTDTAISSGSTYSYYVLAYDVSGNTSTNSNTLSITIPAPAVTLSITSYAVTKKTGTTATITWTTNIPSSGTVSYGTTATTLTGSSLDSTYSTSHTATLNGLTPSTKYYYQITTTASGATNTATTPVSTFRTGRK